MQTGILTVTGESSASILLKGRPKNIVVHFKCDPDHVPCNPHHHDHLHWKIKHEDEPHHVHKKFNHHHHDRLFYLDIEWNVAGIREVCWVVIY